MLVDHFVKVPESVEEGLDNVINDEMELAGAIG